MRPLLPLFLVIASACTTRGQVDVVDADLEREWLGRYEGEGCWDGTVSLAVEQDEDGWWGTYTYESDVPRFWGGDVGHVAVYDVQGDIVDGVLVLDQTDLLDADELDSGSQWCFGRMHLGLFSGADDSLAGSWVADDCACSGDVTLGE